MTQFTASEVRDAITWKYGDKSTRISAMLTAFADLLEAREKAVPVMIVNHVSSAEHDLPIGMKLYTRPSPADAERLAEALHSIGERLSSVLCDPFGEVVVRGSDDDRQIIAQALKDLGELAAHSAQAQPPADQFDPERNVRPGDVGTELQTAEQDAADFGTGFEVDGRRVAPERVRIFRGEHAAQPPAASVTDAKDAARYRWLRLHYDVSASRHGVNDLLAIRLPQESLTHTGSIMDSFVDNAMLAAQENPNG